MISPHKETISDDEALHHETPLFQPLFDGFKGIEEIIYSFSQNKDWFNKRDELIILSGRLGVHPIGLAVYYVALSTQRNENWGHLGGFKTEENTEAISLLLEEKKETIKKIDSIITDKDKKLRKEVNDILINFGLLSTKHKIAIEMLILSYAFNIDELIKNFTLANNMAIAMGGEPEDNSMLEVLKSYYHELREFPEGIFLKKMIDAEENSGHTPPAKEKSLSDKTKLVLEGQKTKFNFTETKQKKIVKPQLNNFEKSQLKRKDWYKKIKNLFVSKKIVLSEEFLEWIYPFNVEENWSIEKKNLIIDDNLLKELASIENSSNIKSSLFRGGGETSLKSGTIFFLSLVDNLFFSGIGIASYSNVVITLSSFLEKHFLKFDNKVVSELNPQGLCLFLDLSALFKEILRLNTFRDVDELFENIFGQKNVIQAFNDFVTNKDKKTMFSSNNLLYEKNKRLFSSPYKLTETGEKLIEKWFTDLNLDNQVDYLEKWIGFIEEYIELKKNIHH